MQETACKQWHIPHQIINIDHCCLSHLQVIDGRYTDTIITAAGPVGWDGQQVEPNMNTMVVTGASGLLAGAEGTIVLMGADDANKKTVTFNLRLNSDAGMHGKTN